MDQLILDFERGGTLKGPLSVDDAPETIHYLRRLLPLLDATVYHTRWCGREINMPLPMDPELEPPPRENQTTTAAPGDIVYWREWPGGFADTGQQALAVYYGAEKVRDHRGPLPVNVIGHIGADQAAEITRIGERVWLQGAEGLTCRIVPLQPGLQESSGEGGRGSQTGSR